MRFVTPEVVRIQLTNGDWIDIKKELTTGEEKRYRTAGFRNLTPADDETGTKGAIDIDWARMAQARVETYLVDWSAKGSNGKDLAVSRAAIEALAQDDFKAIDDAIQAHIQAQSDEKKATAGAQLPAPPLP